MCNKNRCTEIDAMSAQLRETKKGREESNKELKTSQPSPVEDAEED